MHVLGLLVDQIIQASEVYFEGDHVAFVYIVFSLDVHSGLHLKFQNYLDLREASQLLLNQLKLFLAEKRLEFAILLNPKSLQLQDCRDSLQFLENTSKHFVREECHLL